MDVAQAVEWFRNSVQAGCILGMVNLGAMYENGLGVPKNVAQAIEWYRRATAAGSQEAAQALTRLSK